MERVRFSYGPRLLSMNTYPGAIVALCIPTVLFCNTKAGAVRAPVFVYMLFGPHPAPARIKKRERDERCDDIGIAYIEHRKKTEIDIIEDAAQKNTVQYIRESSCGEQSPPKKGLCVPAIGSVCRHTQCKGDTDKQRNKKNMQCTRHRYRKCNVSIQLGINRPCGPALRGEPQIVLDRSIENKRGHYGEDLGPAYMNFFLQSMHAVADGKARRRSGLIIVPHFSQIP